VDRLAARPRGRDRLGCANVAHAVAALGTQDKEAVLRRRLPTLAIVTAYNDVVSAHRPYEHYPELLRDEARRRGAVAQVAGGVPAMCDGITQGGPGMELSLLSRDVIAMSTAVALSHDVFDAALLLGVCDKIAPGLLIGALHLGHVPAVFVPSGPMPTGLANSRKAALRQQHAQGLVDRAEVLDAETQAYSGAGTCTFYGTANTNQLLLEVMGLQLPGSSFVPTDHPLREPLTRASVGAALALAAPEAPVPLGRMVDEKAVVNAMAALLATGGSTNHLIHWVAVARAAGIVLDWSDVHRLGAVVPLLARIYPNGPADINDFHRAGGVPFVVRELLRGGLLHPDVRTVIGEGLDAYTLRPEAAEHAGAGEPILRRTGSAAARRATREPARAPVWRALEEESGDDAVLRPVDRPFSPTGGLALLEGNLGRAVIKVSAVAPEHLVVEAPAFVVEDQADLVAAWEAGDLDRDVVVVVRFQGPRANGMPELHKLTPPLSALLGAGHRVALVTDGRMSGASGTVPAAIHVTPEAAGGGPLARLRTGDVVRVDAVAGTLSALVDPTEWETRVPAVAPPAGTDLGRSLFATLRANAARADEGAGAW
jgi:phosphogluconate dehydratase